MRILSILLSIYFLLTINSRYFKSCVVLAEGEITIPNKIRFPYGDPVVPFIGIFVAIAFPVDINNIELAFSVNLEANYNLPSNETEYTYPPDISSRATGSSLTRRDVYQALESKFNGHGYPGKECMLRMICEGSEKILNVNGLLGDLLDIILKPSSSTLEDNLTVYQKAEKYGTTKMHCKKYKKKCPVSVLDIFTWKK